MPRRINLYLADRIADRIDEVADTNCISRNAAASMIFVQYFQMMDAQKSMNDLPVLLGKLDEIKKKMDDMKGSESA